MPHGGFGGGGGRMGGGHIGGGGGRIGGGHIGGGRPVGGGRPSGLYLGGAGRPGGHIGARGPVGGHGLGHFSGLGSGVGWGRGWSGRGWDYDGGRDPYYHNGLYGYYAVGNGVNYYMPPNAYATDGYYWPQYDSINMWGGVTPNQVYYQNWTNPYAWPLQRINDCLECGADLNDNPICSNCM